MLQGLWHAVSVWTEFPLLAISFQGPSVSENILFGAPRPKQAAVEPNQFPKAQKHLHWNRDPSRSEGRVNLAETEYDDTLCHISEEHSPALFKQHTNRVHWQAGAKRCYTTRGNWLLCNGAFWMQSWFHLLGAMTERLSSQWLSFDTRQREATQIRSTPSQRVYDRRGLRNARLVSGHSFHFLPSSKCWSPRERAQALCVTLTLRHLFQLVRISSRLSLAL